MQSDLDTSHKSKCSPPCGALGQAQGQSLVEPGFLVQKLYNLFPFSLSDRGHYFFSVYAARLMVAQGRGMIITISSMGGLRYLFNVPYGVGKAAVRSLLVFFLSRSKNLYYMI